MVFGLLALGVYDPSFMICQYGSQAFVVVEAQQSGWVGGCVARDSLMVVTKLLYVI